MLIACFLGVLSGLSVGLAPFERYWVRLEMKSLPVPSDVFVGIAGAVRSPLGAAFCGLVMLASMVAVLRGRCDTRLGVIILVMIGLTLLLVIWFVAAIYLPTIRSHGPRSPLLD